MTTVAYKRMERDTFSASAAYPAFLAEGRGACAGDDLPDDFTEDGDGAAQQHMRERARSVCKGCPFRPDCDEWATRTHQQGMWGGRSTWDRSHGHDPFRSKA
jgi:WhiB family transcriptional regulator, redox-sensing transcriptional regulator